MANLCFFFLSIYFRTLEFVFSLIILGLSIDEQDYYLFLDFIHMFNVGFYFVFTLVPVFNQVFTTFFQKIVLIL